MHTPYLPTYPSGTAHSSFVSLMGHARTTLAQAAAMKAYIDLDGRYFGGRNVWVCFYAEADFEADKLAPSSTEPK